MTKKKRWNMTWGEFKKAVDALGAKDDEEIWYIDVSCPRPDQFTPESRAVYRQGNLGLAVSN